MNVPDGIYHISCADPKWYLSVTYEHDCNQIYSFVSQAKKDNFPTHFKVINQPFVDRGTVSLLCPGTGQNLRQRPFNYCQKNGFTYNRLCFDISTEMFGRTSDETEFVFYGAKNEESGEKGAYKVIIRCAGNAFVRVQKGGYPIASESDPSKATVFLLSPRFDQKICECLFKN